MPTAVYPVVASHDDTSFLTVSAPGYPTYTECRNEDNYLWLFYERYGDQSERWYVGVRFQGVVPIGATHLITAAYIRMRAYDSYSTQAVRIYGNDTNNAVVWESPNCNPDDRAKTTAYVNWNTGAIVSGTWYNTPSLVTTVQEIIDRPGWASTNAMAFTFARTANAKETVWYSFDGGSPPELHLTWVLRRPAYGGGMIC